MNLDEVAIGDRLQGEAAASGFTKELLCGVFGDCALRITENIIIIESRVTITAVLKDNNLIAALGSGFSLTIVVTRVTRISVAVITFLAERGINDAVTTVARAIIARAATIDAGLALVLDVIGAAAGTNGGERRVRKLLTET